MHALMHPDLSRLPWTLFCPNFDYMVAHLSGDRMSLLFAIQNGWTLLLTPLMSRISTISAYKLLEL